MSLSTATRDLDRVRQVRDASSLRDCAVLIRVPALTVVERPRRIVPRRRRLKREVRWMAWALVMIGLVSIGLRAGLAVSDPNAVDVLVSPPRVSLSFEPAGPVALALPRTDGPVLLKGYVLPAEGVEGTRDAGP